MHCLSQYPASVSGPLSASGRIKQSVPVPDCAGPTSSLRGHWPAGEKQGSLCPSGRQGCLKGKLGKLKEKSSTGEKKGRGVENRKGGCLKESWIFYFYTEQEKMVEIEGFRNNLRSTLTRGEAQGGGETTVEDTGHPWLQRPSWDQHVLPHGSASRAGRAPI